MPLVRFSVKNEYGLGVKELYKDGVEAEDPKAVLNGVAVAGLVGLLRQLGDLSQFAAEVFHGLQEQVASTASRSRKLVTRVQRVEASLPSLEKAILSQTSHIHFAYTPGSEWHPRIGNEQNHFICDDLPHFIMDSYEECREPPRLQLLDRFDTGGPGSCLKRYSDPTFFRRASASLEAPNREKSLRERKSRKIKKRKSLQRSAQFPNNVSKMNGSGRDQFPSQNGQGLSTLSNTGCTFDTTFRADLQDHTDSVGSKEGLGFAECFQSSSVQPNKSQNSEVFSSKDGNIVAVSRTVDPVKQTGISIADNQCSPASEINRSCVSNVTWDEKLEIMEHVGLNYGSEDVQRAPETNSFLQDQGCKPVTEDEVHDLSENGHPSNCNSTLQYLEANINVKLMDAELKHVDEGVGSFEREEKHVDANGVDYLREQEVKHVDAVADQQSDESEPGMSPMADVDELYGRTTMDRDFAEPLRSNELHFQEQEAKSVTVDNSNQVEDLPKPGSSPDLNASDKNSMTTLDGGILDLTERNCSSDEVQDLHETNNNLPEHDVLHSNPESLSQLPYLFEGTDSLKLSAEESFVSNPSDSKFRRNKSKCLRDTDDYDKWEIEQINAEHVDSSFPQVADLSICESNSEPAADGNFVSDAFDSKLSISDAQLMLEANLDNSILEVASIDGEYVGNADNIAGVNNMNAIEWYQHDDVDSETDNFVDALNTIDSESESENEGQTKRVASSASRIEFAENAPGDLVPDGIIHLRLEQEFDFKADDHRDGVYDDSKQPTASVSLSVPESLENARPPLNQFETATFQEHNKPLPSSSDQSVITDSSGMPCVSDGMNHCADEQRLQPAACNIAAFSPEASLDVKTACTTSASQPIVFGSTSSFPHALWTNGTLLGLQPSKPPVFSGPSSAHSAPVSQSSPKVDFPTEHQCSLEKVNDHCDNLHSDGPGERLFKQASNVSEKTSNEVFHRNDPYSSNCADTNDLGDDHAALHERKLPTADNSKTTFSEATSTIEDRSSILSLLGRGLKNGLRRSGSFGYDEKTKASSLTTNDSENLFCAFASDPLSDANYNNLKSPVNSPPPSPPLEHMKISFHPIDGFETSRLKLNYPEGIDHHEGTVDMFPSFQLVPESTSLPQDISESDDDTFCRSYPCLSDEAGSDPSDSDSDSEQWESGDTSESNDHAYYEGLRRMSSIDSGPSSPEYDVKDRRGAVHSVCGPTSQSQRLHTRRQFAYREMKACLNPGDSSYLQELMPQPPPLPPLMWRVSRPVQVAEEDKPEQGTGLNQCFDSKLVESDISHSASVGSAKLQNTMPESDTTVLQSKMDELKVNDQKPDKHAANGKTVDDREDFLHQIRTKSFNLKRTETARPLHAPSPVASNKVTAILRKANAIRQVVGSDGENDSWSDNGSV